MEDSHCDADDPPSQKVEGKGGGSVANHAQNQIEAPRSGAIATTTTNLTPNMSSTNLVSSDSQALDTSSLRTNYSSDCMATYDSDSCRPLSRDSSSARVNTIQMSPSQLGYNHAIVGDLSDFDDTDGCESSRAANNQPERQFTIGPPQDSEMDETNLIQNDLTNEAHYGRHRTHSMYDDQDINQDDDDDQDYDLHKQVIVGICAMEKKAQSKPMKEILRRLEDYFEYIKTLIFEESVILNKPIEDWPQCDCLISFHSKGFPLSKAIEYARLRRPFLVNDLDIQYDIQDRRKVYKILEEADIELPRYAVLDRDSSKEEERELVESDDHIEVSNFVFNKPFVEKPISAEDHNICIYYPAHAGGGSQRLFRKIGCRSSVYSNESHVRKTGSYIYEEFMPTDGTDVKVYTAGPDYAHAEARKSPALDGKVERDRDGKEIRYPVILTNREKLIARKVCLAFKQTICGFDLLRANGKSYVCDVNGFSFVKSSMKYYEDCSKILGNMMLRALAPQLHIPWSIPFQLDDPPIVPTTFGRMMELRCVIAVIRHGDRTPKQKMKLEVKHSKFFELYHKYGKNGQAKLKKPKQLQEVLDIARYLLGEFPDQPSSGEVIEPRVKLRQLKSVLEMYGHFSGINRKVQLKYQPHGRPRRSSSEDDCAREPSLVLILKWGGELTPAGRVQAEDLGRCFRRLYPASGDYSGPQGLGLLRLHSTFRHDLKIYASDEGRVQMTAAAFAKGFLALEGELTPILFQMVKSANTNGLLDNDCESSKCQKIVKERLHNIMQKNQDLSAEDIQILNPTGAPSIESACKFIENPYQACEKVHKLIKELNTLIRTKRQDNGYTQEYHLYHGETWDLLQRRWAKLEKDFKFPRSKRFDISKIPDIYDCIKYDLQHNQHTLQFQFAHELHTYAKALADIVIPQEYGITAQEKLMISLGTCSPLLRKIQADLLRNADSTNEDDTESVNRLDPKYSHGVSSPDRHVRTRLYFTSESHIHSLVTALQYGGLLDIKRDEQWRRSMEFLAAISELNYLSQIVIMLYEDPTKEPTASDRFHVEIHFSSGVINRISQQNMPSEPQGPGFRPQMHNKSYSNASDDSTSVSQQQQQTKVKHQDAMIKEEPTDDERSTDEGSRANSKSSSVCMTPKKSNSPSTNNSTSAAGGAAATATAAAVVGNQVEESDSLPDNGQTLTQSNVSKFAQRSPQRLSRSYSAVAPVSLQNLFKKQPNEDDGSGAVATDGQSAAEQSAASADSKRDASDQVTAGDYAQAGASSQTQAVDQDEVTRLRDINRVMLTKNSSESLPPPLKDCREPITRLSTVATTSLESYDDDRSQTSESTRDSPSCLTAAHSIESSCYGGFASPSVVSGASGAAQLSLSERRPRRPITPKIQVKTGGSRLSGSRPPPANGENEIPSLLNSEGLSQTPQHLRSYQMSSSSRRYHHQHHLAHTSPADASSIQLPPTYHTIHHLSFSPSALPALVASSSASVSTSPQANLTGGGAMGAASNLHLRYMAHKQQQFNKQFFTLSASMPIHYKANQNPRACSVADVSQYCGGPSSLISTAVISGSSPELVAVCPYSPTIRPLETLHNELSLRQFSDFINRLTRNQRQQSVNVNCASSLLTSAANASDNGDHSESKISSSKSTGQQHEQQQQQRQPLTESTGRPASTMADGRQQFLSLNFDPSSNSLTSGGQVSSSNSQNGGGTNQPLGLSPGNSLSNSLIWGGLSSSPGVPSSPSSAALELWIKLELDDNNVDSDDQPQQQQNCGSSSAAVESAESNVNFNQCNSGEAVAEGEASGASGG